MIYQEALDWILGFQQFGSKMGLDRMEWLMERLDHPERSLRFVHVAGTNGKGSTTAMVASILESQGYRVGMYTSPYLDSFTNRIVVNGKDISGGQLVRLVSRIRPLVEEVSETELGHPTVFEVITALALLFFVEERADFVSWEVGLGGRLDATNVIPTPAAGVITNIALEHTQILGDTLPQIAGEKAGIIKQGGWVVTGDRQPEVLEVFRRRCQAEGAKLWEIDRDFRAQRTAFDMGGQRFSFDGPGLHLDDVKIQLLGAHQIDNAAVALAAICALRQQGYSVSEQAILDGLAASRWAGRLEIMQHDPLVVLDGAHNMHGIVALRRAAEEFFPDHKRILVMGILGDKDYAPMLLHMAPLARKIILTQPEYKRAANVDQLAAVLQGKGYDVELVPAVPDAVRTAISQAQHGEMVLVCGSLYTVSEARAVWRE